MEKVANGVRAKLSILSKHANPRAIGTASNASIARIMSTITSASTGETIKLVPAVSQRILHNGMEYTTVKEGLAYILIPASASTVPQATPKGDNEAQPVFYNPIQQFNRDLSVLAIKAYGEEILERKKADIQRGNLKKRRKRKRENDDKGDKLEKEARSQINDKVEEPLDKSALDASWTQEGTDTASTSIGLENDFEKHGEAPTAGLENTSTMPADNITSLGVALEAPAPQFKILDALSATGLRALRYAHELPFVTSVTANDLQFAATKTIRMNVEHNKLETKIASTTENAQSHMYKLAGGRPDSRGQRRESGKYDVIDLDPYGTAAPFLDAAVQAVREDGGLLCVTCTDSGVWASSGYPEKCFALYGGIPTKGLHSHEGGLRLVLYAIATSAARYGLAMEPLLSLSIDFYVRIFVRINKSPADVKFLAGKTMIVSNCDSGCGAWSTQLLARNKIASNKSGKGTFYKHSAAVSSSTSESCSHCGFKPHLAGPMYAGPLHSPSFIERILRSLPHASKETYTTTERLEGMLTVALEEDLSRQGPARLHPSGPNASNNLQPPQAPMGRSDPAALELYPFYFIPSALSKVIHCETPPEDAIRGALRRLGYRVTRSHAKAGSIKTDAPWSVIWEVMREWARQRAPISPAAVKEGSAGWTILGLNRDKEKARQYFGKLQWEGDRKSSERESETNIGECKDGDPKNGGMELEQKEIRGGEEDMDVDLDVDLEGGDNGKRGGNEESKLEVMFDEKLGREKDGKKLVRYQVNPRENWGPMNKAKGR